MSALFKKIFMVLIGILAGIASWAIIEICLYYGELTGRHIVWNGLTGAFIGLIFGFFFSSAEGVMFSNSSRAIQGGIIGSILGFLGGAAAMILSQWLLYALVNTEMFTKDVTNNFMLPLSRAVGWGILGVVVGSLDGLRGGSARRTFVGITGGLVGGFIGGLLLEFLTRRWSNGLLARGTGIIMMGIGIGLFLAIFEYSRSFGILKILTGPYKGKDYVLIMKNTRIGSSRTAHLPIVGYSGVSRNHALFVAGKNGVIIKKEEGPVMVNDKPITERELKFEDVIQIGSAKILYLPK